MKFEDDDPARKHLLPYPMEIGGQKFELVEVTKQKDIMLNVARMYAQQEYDRIMEMVAVLLHLGPGDWTSSPPANYEYVAQVKWLGDHTWTEITPSAK